MTNASIESKPTIVNWTQRLEQATQLDVLVQRMQPLADALLADKRRADLLRGMWLGHAIHPIMTFVPLGAWTSSTILDLAGGATSRQASQRLVAVGILSAVPTAIAGVAEFGPIARRDQRVAAVHSVSNTVALVLFAASWNARRKGAHARGVALGLLAHAGTGLGGYLGGHLTEARKVSSRHPAYADSTVA